MNEPIGRRGSWIPLRLRRTAFEIASIASFFGRKARQRNAGHLRDDFGNHLVVDQTDLFVLARFPLFLEVRFPVFQLFEPVAKLRGRLEILFADGVLLLLFKLFHLVVKIFQIRRTGQRLKVNARTGLVDDIDRLVG